MKTVTMPKKPDMTIRLEPIKMRLPFVGRGRKTRHEPRRSRRGDKQRMAKESF
jgi:hypothetical protein